MKSVLLVNLGGPRNTLEIQKFLTDLFTDPYVFDLPLPEWIRFRLAKFIARKRAPKVAANYLSMGFGGGSPLVAETQKQAKALQETLERKTGEKWNCKIAMTCGYPDIRDLNANELTPNPETIILPLFPHFSRSTVMSLAMILKDKIGICPAKNPGWVTPFYDRIDFLDASANLILDYFRGNLNPNEFIALEPSNGISNWHDIHIQYSAHGIPRRLIEKGDQYRTEIESYCNSITERLRIEGFQGTTGLSFQSRVGPAKWTEPNTIPALQELGKEGKRRIAVVPVSFVGDHLETLEEIGQQLKEVAYSSGVDEYYRVPAQGTYQPFIDSLADAVIESSQRETLRFCLCHQSGGHPSCI